MELWGDEVESLQLFNPESQRSLKSAGGELLCPPVREELLISPFKEQARRGILKASAAQGIPSRDLQAILDDLHQGIPFMGVEAFRPAFYPKLEPILEALPRQGRVRILDPMGVGEHLRDHWDLLSGSYEKAQTGPLPCLPPEVHSLRPSDLLAALSKRQQIRAHTLQVQEEISTEGPREALRFEVQGNQDLRQALENLRGGSEPLKPLAEEVRAWVAEGLRVLITCRQETQLNRLERLLKNYGVHTERALKAAAFLEPTLEAQPGVILLKGDLTRGFRLLSQGFCLLTEGEIFGRKAPKRRAPKRDSGDPFLQSFRELSPGDHVVHADHGLGRYAGLKKMVLGNTESDFLIIEFAGRDKLYLPVYKLGRLQKYVGKPDPRRDKLGGSAWQKVQGKARKSAEEDALLFLNLYARREMAKGYAFSPPDDLFRSFEASFPFEETPDQARAIEEIIADMRRERPMDRLLCGDVGFGKTEVALRAAMKAVLDGKQMALLVPTTVLALQHFRNFKERFAQYPVRVELLSRLVGREASREVIQDLKRGRVDIIVGTHRLLSKDVCFKDLGLLVLDEEHRFGVKHKEKLKEMRAQVDVLSMTATPIPRTLQLSLGGLRDLSVITTAPSDRLSVRTYICRSSDQLIRDAIMRELQRGGQSFFIHNRVHSIEARRAWLTALIPEARIIVGHGQIKPKRLEKVMVDFSEGRYNLLLSTTIIESGIDIPNANTMLIDQADHFGLAQLYQLRGRVGRSRERGYCYLMVPSEAVLRPEARERLSIIQKFTELGSGFQIASHDMELRGAGELLGTRQKGHVQAVGLDMYSRMLAEAVRKLRGEKPPLEFDPEIKLQTAALLPEEYIPDSQLRLLFYKRLANSGDEEDVLALAEEMEDRFGPLPGIAENLVELMRIRSLARYIGLKSLELRGSGPLFNFHPESPMPVAAIIKLVSSSESRFRATAERQLIYDFSLAERRETLETTRICLQRLAELLSEAEE